MLTEGQRALPCVQASLTCLGWTSSGSWGAPQVSRQFVPSSVPQNPVGTCLQALQGIQNWTLSLLGQATATLLLTAQSRLSTSQSSAHVLPAQAHFATPYSGPLLRTALVAPSPPSHPNLVRPSLRQSSPQSAVATRMTAALVILDGSRTQVLPHAVALPWMLRTIQCGAQTKQQHQRGRKGLWHG
jgi:hypothetical protein